MKHKSLYPLMPFKYNFRRRRDSLKRTLELLNLREAKIIVETGTSRKGLRGTKSDGAATIVFGKWAKENNAHLYSVDINKDSIKGSQDEVNNQQLKDVVTLHLGDSIEYLSTFHKSIDCLYLDSFDYSRTDKDIQLKSQAHHLKELKVAEDKMHNNTVVLIDDCGLPGGGKGKTVVEYMLQKDWKIILNTYQILLVKKGSVL